MTVPECFTEIPLGEVISKVYEEMLAEYGDEELAAVATAEVVNELLYHEAHPGTDYVN